MSSLDFNELKKGAVMVWQGQPHEIMTAQFVRMQQRKPVMQMKMRNLFTGKVVEYSAKSGESFERADIQKHKVQFLYADRDGAHFMNQETFETVDISPELSAEKVGFLKEGTDVNLVYFDDKPISVELPIKVDLEVKSTPPGIRGDTATGGSKPATLETGLTINVPLFINEGDKVRVNTETGQYAERAN
jgi:elongation factor P